MSELLVGSGVFDFIPKGSYVEPNTVLGTAPSAALCALMNTLATTRKKLAIAQFGINPTIPLDWPNNLELRIMGENTKKIYTCKLAYNKRYWYGYIQLPNQCIRVVITEGETDAK